MDNNFKIALKFVLKWEGGYVNDPDDKGGETNKGVTQSVYNSYRRSKNLNIQDVRHITGQEVEDIYYNRYWLAAGCDKMALRMAVVVFDTAVNMGVGKPKEYFTELGYKINPDQFIDRRDRSYRKYALAKGQSKFLKGWLNRTSALRGYILGLKD